MIIDFAKRMRKPRRGVMAFCVHHVIPSRLNSHKNTSFLLLLSADKILLGEYLRQKDTSEEFCFIKPSRASRFTNFSQGDSWHLQYHSPSLT